MKFKYIFAFLQRDVSNLAKRVITANVEGRMGLYSEASASPLRELNCSLLKLGRCS
jgi:hypothetical protein